MSQHSIGGSWRAEYLEGIHIYLSDRTFYGIAVLPGAITETAFDIQSRTLAYISFCHLGRRIPHHYIVSLGAPRPLGTVRQSDRSLVSRKRERGYGTFLHIADLRITPHIAEKYYLINAHTNK